MSNLPCELLDHIVDLHFRTQKNLELWKKTFPDPSTSPARYAKTLFIHCPQVITAAGAEAGCWIGGFPHVVRLVMVAWERFAHEWGDTFALFHGISPIIKSLCVDFVPFSFSQLFDLILSFSLLEDLSVTGYCYSPVKLCKALMGHWPSPSWS